LPPVIASSPPKPSTPATTSPSFAQRSGAVVGVVQSDEAGEFDVEALERMIDRREQWFLDAAKDPERRCYLFSGPSMGRPEDAAASHTRPNFEFAPSPHLN
jgi:hypothetical protein